MKLKKVNDIQLEEVAMYGSTGTKIQWIWSKKDGMPHFAMRKFILSPGGEIGLHHHPEEHEIYILSGKGVVFNDSDEIIHVQPEDALYVPSNEPHGYKNIGKEDLVFLCLIPLL
jgi:quercetin dioxygenase-like cupin family protein